MRLMHPSQAVCAIAALLLTPSTVNAMAHRLPLPSNAVQSMSAGDQSKPPGCEGVDAARCLESALNAMGGRERLAAVKSVRLDVIGHTALTEQSYRQSPFITSYESDQILIDHE